MPFESRQAVSGSEVTELLVGGKLAFDDDAWKHLNFYVKELGKLPAALDSGSEELDSAVEGLRSAAADFGSPRHLRGFLTAEPKGLSGNQPAREPYSAIVWSTQQLQSSAAAVASLLKTLSGLDGPVAGRRVGLRELGVRADEARAGLVGVQEVFAGIEERIFDADQQLTAAYRSAASDLQTGQEALGGLEGRIDGLRAEIDGLGFLRKRKKPELEERLASSLQELDRESARVETLRRALSTVEPVIDEGHWLARGFRGVTDFLDLSNRLWTSFGSRMAQLAVDATDDQLDDREWLTQALGAGVAIESWQRIAQNAKSFVTGALIDFTKD